MVNGYVVATAQGLYLSYNLAWVRHDCPDEAYVHQPHTVRTVAKTAHTWDIKPELLYPANYYNGTVEITGKPFPFEEHD